MALAALIAAYTETPSSGAPLRATLPIAGRTLLERQARLAAAVGATPVVILVEAITPDLAAAIDRLRAEGVSALVARSLAEAADSIPPEQRVLLVGDGLSAEASHFTRAAGANETTIFTVPDAGADDRHERIDANSRWAGLALVTGALLRDTAAMLQDWDPQSTLLRRAVQDGARLARIRLDDGFLLIADDAGQLAEAEQTIVRAAGGRGRGWVSRLLLAPIERLATRALMPTRLTPGWLYLGAALMTGVAAVLFVRGWLWAGGLLLVLATPLDGLAERLASVRLQAERAPGWWHQLMPAAGAAALLALGYNLSLVSGWGCILLAATVTVFLFALDRETGTREIEGREWLAERKGMTWLMLPFAATGYWLAGLAVLVLYAGGSFFWAQREVHRNGET